MIMNEEQKEFVKMIHDFCEKEIKPNVAQWDRDGYFPLEEVYNKLFEMGISRKKTAVLVLIRQQAP